MQIEYDRENDVAYVSLVPGIEDGAAVSQVTVGAPGVEAELTLDFDASGQLLGIEVLGARAALPAELLAGGEARQSFGPKGALPSCP
ncbi:DUF2283 domain-containing protein [Streptomyces sp. MUM 203J]|uniref:DUF2283 domain-containing protein n=1 Tax=Streptomyces sp. MUM 203J TaxID=2791990 RepID=UPI001F034D75|nr:DUF2283 domain-containing protein [Streptomyces sp. MUM 203J]MCH0540407.1 DUF2283 domain-containing protein [Streptomyces sp. MUM 203J]